MKMVITAIFLLALFSAAAMAQQSISPEKKELIHQFAGLTKTNEVDFNVTFSAEGLQKKFADMIDADHDLSDVQKADLRKEAEAAVSRVNARAKPLIDQNPEFQQIGIQAAFDIYDKAFTETELKELIAFYKTPLGQKAATFLASIKNDIGTAFEKGVAPKMKALVDPILDEETAAFTKKLQDAKRARN